MKRSEFLKSLGLGAGGLIIPNNTFISNKDVKVYDNYLKGVMHYEYTKIASNIKEGSELTLVREVENKYDSYAVSVYCQNCKLGYIAAFENIVLANMLDNSVVLKGYVSKHDPKTTSYQCLAIEIFTQLVIPTQKLITQIATEQRADDAIDRYRKGF
jgi:hypothetical protein